MINRRPEKKWSVTPKTASPTYPATGCGFIHLCSLAEACVVLRDKERAAQIYDLLAPYADRNAIAISTMPYGPVALRLGMIAALLERWDETDKHFELAMERCERLGARAITARVLYEHATDAPGQRSREGFRSGDGPTLRCRADLQRARSPRCPAESHGVRSIDARSAPGPARCRAAGTIPAQGRVLGRAIRLRVGPAA